MKTCPKCNGNLFPMPDRETLCLQCGFRLGDTVRYSPPEILDHTEIKKTCRGCKSTFIILIANRNISPSRKVLEAKYCKSCRVGVTSENATVARFHWAGLQVPEVKKKGTPIHKLAKDSE